MNHSPALTAAGGRAQRSLRAAVAEPLRPDVAEADALLMALVRDLLYVEDRTSDLPLRQLHVCAALQAAPQTMSELSRKLGVSMSAMTQIADRLERSGMASRQSNEPDRRVRRLILTPRSPGDASSRKRAVETPGRGLRVAGCGRPRETACRPAAIPIGLCNQPALSRF